MKPKTFTLYTIAVWGIVSALLSIALVGCGGGTGWQVSFGVVPITAVDNQQKLINRAQVVPASAKGY